MPLGITQYGGFLGGVPALTMGNPNTPKRDNLTTSGRELGGPQATSLNTPPTLYITLPKTVSLNMLRMLHEWP